jgi:hypothetical protein
MEQALIHLAQAMSTLVSTKMESLTEKALILGPAAKSILATLSMGSSMEKENGNQPRASHAAPLREITLLIKKLAQVFSPGQVEMYTKATTKRTRDMA